MMENVPRLRKWSWLMTALAVIVAGFLIAMHGRAGALPSSGLVVAVFDGDTVLLAEGQKVRYLGIDAPEVAHGKDSADCFGNEARKANGDWVLHKKVRLEYDKEQVDSYGRLLAYVFTPDGKCVNAEMMRAGYACVLRFSEPFSRLKELLDLQREAIRNRRGMWGGCSTELSPYYIGNRRSFVFHRATCHFGKKVSRRARVQFQTRWMGLEEGFRPARCCKP
jgi:micrococcal nuclease